MGGVLLLSADPALKTPRDIRQATEGIGKAIRVHVEAMRSSGDDVGAQVLEFLGLRMTQPS